MRLSTLIDRWAVKLIRNHEESRYLRDRFRKRHGMEIGGYTIGGFDRWRLSSGTRIGRYASLAGTVRIVDANHPMDALSTNSLFYLKRWGLVDRDLVEKSATVIEDDVWMGHNAIVTPGCKVVGRGSVIGAGAVVMRDVPRYAIVTGNPARVLRYRFAPDVIEAIEATRWWELDRAELAAAGRQAPGFLTNPTVAGAQAFMRALGREPFVPAMAEALPGGETIAALDEASLVGLVAQEIPGFTAVDLDRPLAQLPIDSFGLINLRLLVERATGARIDDRKWSRITRLRDIASVGGGSSQASPSPAPVLPPEMPRAIAGASAEGAHERRVYTLNMPQMALRGLSESWLFKEVGDLHWSNITRGLRTTSARIADDGGNRLYATFTRFVLESDVPLAAYRENDEFAIDMAATRLGAGIFFGDATLAGPSGRLRARVMTSFSKFGEAGANTSLLKGQPAIPDDCPIPTLDAMPAFGLEYRANRAAERRDPLFETDYAILPPHDINGVGLLYFAAYPMIAEVCAIRHGGNRVATEYSTRRRDVNYFANCGPDETLLYRIFRWEETDGVLTIEATISRKSDDKTMAYIATEKVRLR